FKRSAETYTNLAEAEVCKHADFIANFKPAEVEIYKVN
ncbi:Acyl-CoA dehydrogenase C-terminal domain-containing protein, partial [Duncaniella muris]